MLTCGVWVGCDDRAAHFTSMEYGQGARAAMPVFGKFMNLCYNDPALPYMSAVANPDPNNKTRMRDFVAPDGFTGNAYGCLPKDSEGNEVKTTIIDQKDWD